MSGMRRVYITKSWFHNILFSNMVCFGISLLVCLGAVAQAQQSPTSPFGGSGGPGIGQSGGGFRPNTNQNFGGRSGGANGNSLGSSFGGSSGRGGLGGRQGLGQSNRGGDQNGRSSFGSGGMRSGSRGVQSVDADIITGGNTRPQRLVVMSRGQFEPQKNVKLKYGPLPAPASADPIALIGPMMVPEFLDVISAATGWNIASSPGLKSVNLEFWINDQTPEQAMQVLKADDIFYEYSQDSNMIFVMTKDEYLERRHGEMVRRVFQIRHADLSGLQTGIGVLLSSKGRFIADPRTSTIEVHDFIENLNYIERLINQVDKPRESTTYALEHVNGSALFDSLEILLSESGRISYDPRSNILIVLDRAQQQKQIAATIKALDTPVDTRTWTLNYADIYAVSDQLYTLIPDGMGIITMDEELRTITVSAMASRLDKVDDRIKELDKERKQVQIEAYLVTVGSAVVRSLGIDWAFRRQTGEGFSSTKFGGPVLFGGDNEDGEGEDEDGSGGPLDQLSSGFVSTFLSDNGRLTAALDALETSGDATVNAQPRVTVLDGEEAHFQNVTQVPFATTSERNNNNGFNANSITSTRIEFIDVGTILSVLPRINDDGKVWMSISSEDSSFTSEKVLSNGLETSVPQKTQNVVQTVVVVNDRETIVLGGLSTSSQSDATNKVPIIGDIPIFGRLFRKTDKNHSKKELLIFITPTIIDGSTQQEAYYLAELDQESSMAHFDDRKGDVHRTLDDFLSNDVTISIGHRGGIVINGDFMKMSEAREFIQGPGAKGKLLVIRPHPRSPKRVLNKIVDIAMDADRSYELDNSPMPFVPSTSTSKDSD